CERFPTWPPEGLELGSETSFLADQIVLFARRGKRKEPVDLRHSRADAASGKVVDARVDRFRGMIQAAGLLEQLLENLDGLVVEREGQLVDRRLGLESGQALEDRAIRRIGEGVRVDPLGRGFHVTALVEQDSHELTLGMRAGDATGI